MLANKRFILSVIPLLFIQFFLLTSCDTMVSFMNALFSPVEKPFENKISYEAEEIFYLGDLGYPHNAMYPEKAIDHDGDYIYCVTDDDDYHNSGHGVLIVTDREGKNIRSLVVCEEARKAGHDECYAYELMSVDVYDDVIIVSGQDALMFPRYTELVCFDKETLQVLWHWHSADGGWNFGSATSQWNDKYVFGYDLGRSAFITILDGNGHEIISRKISESKLKERGSLFVNDNRLYMRRKESPYTVFDLALLSDSAQDLENCIIFQEKDDLDASNRSGIISDGNDTYLSAWEYDNNNAQTFISSYDISSNEMNWRNRLDGTFMDVSSILTLHNGKLFVPADYGSIYCLDSSTGKQLWHTDIRKNKDNPFEVNLFQNSCVVSEKWLCMPCNSSQELLVLNIKNGNLETRIKVSLAFNIRLNPTNKLKYML